MAALGYEIAQAKTDRMQDTLASAFIKGAKRHPFRDAIIEDKDSISYIKLAGTAKTLIPIFNWQDDEKRVGILLPPGRAGGIVNLAAAMD